MSQPLGNLPLNSKVKLGSLYGHALQWVIKSKNHSGYPAGAITLVTDKIIKIMGADAKESANSDSNRKSYGNNRHIHANIRQWLNKSGTGWYTAQHSADAPPSSGLVTYNPYDNIAGFLTGFSADEIGALLAITLTVNKASVDGGGQDTFTDKIFLLSGTEAGFTSDTAEGSVLDGFSDNTSRLAYPTDDAVQNSDYTASGLNTGSPWNWWLRTPYASNSCSVRHVNTDGTLNNNNACNGSRGLRPACNPVSSTLVSDAPDADGCYTFIFNQPPTAPSYIDTPETIYVGSTPAISWGESTDPEGGTVSYILERKFNSGAFTLIYEGNDLEFTDAAIPSGNTSVQYRVQAIDSVGITSAYTTGAARVIIQNTPPVISGQDEDLGVFAMDKPGGYEYTVIDTEGGPVTVTERIDDTVIRTFQPVLGQTQTLILSDAAWTKVLNGTHTLRITAQDPLTGQAARTLTFTRNINAVEFIGPVSAFPADAQPTECLIQVVGSFPTGSTLTVKVCNNGNDEEPTWENCTLAVLAGQNFDFTNTVKTAGAWGVKVWIKLERGTAVSGVYITSVGGNFR